MKSLNVLAILLGEGFSVFYDDADDRIWTRLSGVIVGLTYAALVLAITRRLAGHDGTDRMQQISDGSSLFPRSPGGQL
jgi:hypothetical protein